MASSDLRPDAVEVICLADRLDAVAPQPTANRRIHQRLKASDVRWLRGARIKYGGDVHVLDISAGGLLLASDRELERDGNVVLELTGPGGPLLVPSRVLRCRPSLGEVLQYQGACAFKRPLTIPELVACPPPPEVPASRAARAAQSATNWQKVIARYRDGRVVGGYTNDFHPSKTQLHLSADPSHGESTIVPLAQLKALFFVREFVGDATIVDSKVFTAAPQGRKVEVTFHDNEVIVGSTLGYSKDGNGFFVQPADSRSNNLRVFVTIGGMRQMRFL